MLIGIIADLHANLEATRAVLQELDRVGPKRVICLGDVAGYYADPNEVIGLIRERNIPTLSGNHDAAVCGLEEPWFFNDLAKAAIEYQSRILLEEHRQWLAEAPEQIRIDEDTLAVHGAPGNRDDYLLDWLDAMAHVEHLIRAKVSVCFFGHSHRAVVLGERGSDPENGESNCHVVNPHNRYFINPGSVGQPRDHDPRAAFGLYETERRVFEFCRVPYDLETTARKTLEAGLPPPLARRLFEGK
jgi:diadenosine tetraphosphatase ApaH/serine/threonine PP2A family protein phosphatase